MTCESCQQRRRAAFDALMAGALARAAGEVAAGVREMVGLKEKGDEPKRD